MYITQLYCYITTAEIESEISKNIFDIELKILNL